MPPYITMPRRTSRDLGAAEALMSNLPAPRRRPDLCRCDRAEPLSAEEASPGPCPVNAGAAGDGLARRSPAAPGHRWLRIVADPGPGALADRSGPPGPGRRLGAGGGVVRRVPGAVPRRQLGAPRP